MFRFDPIMGPFNFLLSAYLRGIVMVVEYAHDAAWDRVDTIFSVPG
jgi:hypothetical protein